MSLERFVELILPGRAILSWSELFSSYNRFGPRIRSSSRLLSRIELPSIMFRA